MSKLTNQQIYDTVRDHLIAQGRPSLRPSPDGDDSYEGDEWMCAYRGDGGLKCAAGCLIDDADYDPAMENVRVDTWEVGEKITPKFVDPRGGLVLLRRLQEVHDTYIDDHAVAEEGRDEGFVQYVQLNLAAVARLFGLQP